MVVFLVWLIDILVRLIVLLLFANMILSFFMSPFHPVRETLERILRPMLDPIRRYLPPVGGLDFSPVVLFIIISLLGSILRTFLLSL